MLPQGQKGRSCLGTPVVLLVLLMPAGWLRADDFDAAPIHYRTAAPHNVVTQLQKRLDAGKATLNFREGTGYLESLLRELQVPVSSQTLVFSKTSLQRHRITPRTPRALYFNDEVYVGFCQHGDVLEISAVDPRLGTVFYTLDQKPAEAPMFVRQTDNCTLCHASSQTHGVPGHVVRSVFPDNRGMPILASGSVRVDHSTPLDRRWGGWYVTGTHGKQTHMGNRTFRPGDTSFPVENAGGLNRTDLRDHFDPGSYLSPHSDLIALMVLEHQAEGHNLLVQANFAARQALYQEELLNRELKLPADHRWDSTRVRISSAGDALLRYFLFCDEAPLHGELRGTSPFAQEFTALGPKDKQGRSLRDFDLKRRLFRYPCSYLIYSESFAALPDRLREYVLDRLGKILSGADTSKEFAHLDAQQRQAIREILEQTRPALTAKWNKGS